MKVLYNKFTIIIFKRRINAAYGDNGDKRLRKVSCFVHFIKYYKYHQIKNSKIGEGLSIMRQIRYDQKNFSQKF
jgi:hypothetical protein